MNVPRWSQWTVPLSATLVSLGAFLFVRLPTARAASTPQWPGFCNRVQPPDVYPCHADFSNRGTAFLVASVLLWATLVAGPVILALAGRRWWSLAPLAALAVAEAATGVAAWFSVDPQRADWYTVVHWLGRSNPGFEVATNTSPPPVGEAIVDLVLLAVPAVAIIVFRERVVVPTWRLFVVLSGVAAVALTIVANGRAEHPELGDHAGIQVLIPAAVMIVFGLLISGRSPWWPWSVGVLAVGLSFGPQALLLSSVQRFTTTLWFAPAVWLAAIGLVASAHVPLTYLVGQRSAVEHETQRRRFHPVVAANALAVGLLAVTAIAANADPLVPRFETPLPTFLGLRDRAELVRDMDNGTVALHAYERYLRAGGDPARFDAEAGARLAPEVPWRPEDGQHAIHVDVIDGGVRFVVGSRIAACIEVQKDGHATFGTGQGGTAVEEAVSSCSDTGLASWQPPDLQVESMCDGIDRDGIVLCRAIQFYVHELLTDPRA
jgi:hypothetical protein